LTGGLVRPPPPPAGAPAGKPAPLAGAARAHPASPVRGSTGVHLPPPSGKRTPDATRPRPAPADHQPAFIYRPPAENERQLPPGPAGPGRPQTGVHLPPPTRKRTPDATRPGRPQTGVHLPPPSRKRTPVASGEAGQVVGEERRRRAPMIRFRPPRPRAAP